MAVLYDFLSGFRTPQSGEAYVEFLLKKIWHDAYIYRAFMDLVHGPDGRQPSIISNWKAVHSGQFIYIGEGQKPTSEELKEKEAIAWLVSRGIAEPCVSSDDFKQKQWYLLSEFGW